MAPALPHGSSAHIEPEKIARLLNHDEDRESVLMETGFSHNYIMKLQRKVLHATRELQLREPEVIEVVPGKPIHVLWDADNAPLFIKKELCAVLDMKGTTFSYWKKKANVGEIDTSADFRLMDKCRSIFGGRSTYTLYTADDLWHILQGMDRSRQRHHFLALEPLKAVVQPYRSGNAAPVSSPLERVHESPAPAPMPISSPAGSAPAETSTTSTA